MWMRSKRATLSSQTGVTLVELVIAMVIISIALGGVLLAFNQAVSRSADPMLQHQAVAIGEAYLEEILLRPYAGIAGATRASFGRLEDYPSLGEHAPADQEGIAIAPLSAYRVSVAVEAATLGPAGATVPAKRVAVRVTHPSGIDLTLSGYRTDY